MTSPSRFDEYRLAIQQREQDARFWISQGDEPRARSAVAYLACMSFAGCTAHEILKLDQASRDARKRIDAALKTEE